MNTLYSLTTLVNTLIHSAVPIDVSMGVHDSGHSPRGLRPSDVWRVFLSHTSDLREFPRDRSFVAAGESAIIRAGHAVTDMAYFTARDHAPIDYCERMVADASVYVGIVGVRCGTPVRGRPDHSYTELEYEAATALGLPRLIFMTRDGSSALPASSEPTALGIRQQAFRRRLLESDVTVAWIDTPSDLEIGLFQALVELRHSLPTPKFPNQLRQLRFGRFTQHEMATRIGVSLATYKGWERGDHMPQPRHMRALCEALDVQQPELGFGPPSVPPIAEPLPDASVRVGSPSQVTDRRMLSGPSVELPEAIRSSQDEWRQVRRYLAANVAALTKSAANLYPRVTKVSSTTLLTREDWLTAEPVDVKDVQLEWLDGPQRKIVKGTEAEARLVFPLRAPGHQFESYTTAVRYLDRPTLFENRPTYRLLGATVGDRGAAFRFSLATYLEMMDVSLAVAHELTAAHMRSGQVTSLGQLPFRSLIGDPLDLHRRPVQAAIDAVTIRHDARAGTASFFLHWRDPAKVAVGGGFYSVMPVGVFQPSTLDPWGQHLDFDMWRNVVREFSEEFLGMPEHDGSAGARIDYDMWPLYRLLTNAREAGSLRFCCFGLGVDPLALGIDILTAVVIDSEVFDDLFGDRVQVNAEGHVISDDSTGATVGFPFTEESIHRFVRNEPMGPGGAACLALAWRHREALL